MARKRIRKLVAAKFNQRQLSLLEQTFGEAILAALDPNKSVSIREGRTWRISQPTVDDSETWVYGQLGYGFHLERAAASYNENEHRFEETVEEDQDARFCYYLLHIPTRTIVFEERRPEIPWQRFIRVMGMIVEDKGFELDPLVDQKSFLMWLGEVDALLSFDAHMLRPNPSYKEDEDDIRALIADPDSMEVNVKMKARSAEGGLKFAGTILEHAVSFISRGNGKFAAKGRKGAGTSEFRSNERVVSKNYEVPPEESSSSRIETLAEAMRAFVSDAKERLNIPERRRERD